MDDCGLSFMWNDQVPIDKFLLKTTIRQKLSDQFIQHWFSQINNTSRGEIYSLFKNEFQLESYLLELTQGERINITKSDVQTFNFQLKRGDGQVFLKKIERVIFVNQVLEMNFTFYLNVNTLKSKNSDLSIYRLITLQTPVKVK